MISKKRCVECNSLKPTYAFNKDNSRADGLCIYCRECIKRKYKRYYYKDDVIINGIRKRRSNWSDKKKKAVRIQKKLDSRKYVATLTDSYIRKVLIQRSNIAKEDITPEMIKTKREIIRTNRLLKTAKVLSQNSGNSS